MLAANLALCILVAVGKNITAKRVLLSDKMQTEYHSGPVGTISDIASKRGFFTDLLNEWIAKKVSAI
jgi:hypothetical protein